MPDHRLEELASAIVDGRPVDWGSVEQTSETEALRALAKISELHWTLHRSLGGGEEASELDEWGHLRIIESLGAGSFGSVFVALDRTLDRLVALKLLRVPVEDPARVERALAEGRMLARVEHLNVATVYGADVREGRVGLWMELIRGRTLAEMVALDGPFSPHEATLVGLDLCRALAAVYRAGILHRDLKAQNVMREEGGRIVLVDFGVGREAHQPNDEDTPAGTPLYLAPELFVGGEASVRSDLYSLGVLLFHLVTGSFPVIGQSLAELRRAHAEGLRQRLLDSRSDLPAAFVQVVERLLAPSPEERPGSAGEVAGELARALEPVDRLAPPPAHGRSRPFASWLLGGTGIFLLLLVMVWPARTARDGRESEAPGTSVTTSSPKALEMFERSRELHAAGELTYAAEALELAVALDPDFGLAHARLAIYANGDGRWQEALSASERAYELRHQVTPAERFFVEGIFHTYRQRYEKAAESFRKVVEMETDNAEAFRLLALLCGNLGELDEAVKPAQRAVALEPRDVINRGILAVLQATGGRTLGALETVETARHDLLGASAEELVYLYWGEGLAWLVEGDLSRARDAFEKLIRGSATYESHGRLFLAQTHVFAGDLDAAVAVLESGFHLNQRKDFERNVSTGHLFLARVHMTAGRADEARRQLARALEGVPDLPTHLKILREVTLVQAELGLEAEVRSGLARIERIAAAYPSPLAQGSVEQLQGELARLTGAFERAREKLEQARETWEDPLTLRSLARLWLEQDRCDRAVPLLERLVQQDGRIARDFFAGILVEAQRDLNACEKNTGASL